MKLFLSELLTELNKNLYNYHLDNVDYYRFPKNRNSIKNYALAILARFGFFRRSINLMALKNWTEHLEGLNFIYNLLSDQASRRKLVEIISYRILGHNKVKLYVNTPRHWQGVKQIKRIGSRVEVMPDVFYGESLQKFDLRTLGYDLVLFLHPLNVMATYFLQQYRYHGDLVQIGVSEGNIVLDCGGCWGDTALYFAERTGRRGRVHVFEFVASNLLILDKNLDLNPDLKNIVKLVKKPLWSISGSSVYVVDKGPASSISFESQEGAEVVSTITIDDYLASQRESGVDYIKMDIEGAEFEALKGAEKSIRQFRPSLAIAIYHRPEHFYQIAHWIDQLGIGYKFYLDHFTIHSEETILFATVKK